MWLNRKKTGFEASLSPSMCTGLRNVAQVNEPPASQSFLFCKMEMMATLTHRLKGT
jgi:hypothetical protein